MDDLQKKYEKTIRNYSIIEKLESIINSDGYQWFEKESHELLEGWQYSEPASTNFDDRFSLDEEAYIKTCINTSHQAFIEYNEQDLIELLINNLKTAKHPVWVKYCFYLKQKLQIINSGMKQEKFNTIYVISEKKRRFILQNGSVENNNFLEDSFDLRNDNIYDKSTEELIEEETQTGYNSTFLITLSKTYTPKVKPFLNHQLNGSSKPHDFIDYVKYCALYSDIITNEGTKEAIKDWLSEQNEQKKPTKAEKTIKQFIINIKEDKKQKFIDKLKQEFPTEIGVTIKAMFFVLEEFEVLKIGNREMKRCIEVFEASFERPIGSIQSIRDVTIETTQNKANYIYYDDVKTRIEKTIKEYKIK